MTNFLNVCNIAAAVMQKKKPTEKPVPEPVPGSLK